MVMYAPSGRFVYLMGLIDYLGKWNITRRGEMYGKTFLAHFIRQDTDFSVKPPDEFAKRFLKYVKKVFKAEKSVAPPAKEEQYFFRTQVEETVRATQNLDSGVDAKPAFAAAFRA